MAYMVKCPRCGGYVDYTPEVFGEAGYCSKCQAEKEVELRIHGKLTTWAASHVLSIRKAWVTVYKEYQARTGVCPWKGMGTGMENVFKQTGGLDELEAVVDELTFEPEGFTPEGLLFPSV